MLLTALTDEEFLRHAQAQHDLDTPEALAKELERIRRFDSLMNDLTQPLKTLAELAPN